MGEIEPIDDLRLTHGLCRMCYDKGKGGNMVVNRQAEELFRNLFGSSGRIDVSSTLTFIQQAQAAGVNNSDLLMGFLQPALYSIGSMWEAGRITVAQENEFTTWCEKILELLPRANFGDRGPEAVLCPIAGNTHNLGVRFLSIQLEERGHPTLVVTSNLSPQGVIELCLQYRPKLLGISAALQGSFTLEQKNWVSEVSSLLPPGVQMVLGGKGLQNVEQDWKDVKIVKSIEQVLKLLAG